jgi:hypothetical protein
MLTTSVADSLDSPRTAATADDSRTAGDTNKNMDNSTKSAMAKNALSRHSPNQVMS